MNRVHRAETASAARRLRQSGMAIGEVLALLVPVCLLCVAGASRLAATSSARLRGQWEVAGRVQRAARGPCGMNGTLTAPVLAAAASQRAARAWPVLGLSALPVGGFGAGGVPAVGDTAARQSTAVAPYFYRPLADRAFADGIDRVANAASFVCNEPGDPGDGARGAFGVAVEALGFTQAMRLFGTGP